MLVLLAAYLVFGEFDESDPAQNGNGADSSTASQTADENNGLSENGATQFQAENTDEEELAKRYYYSQLDENRQMIYRELVQGIAEHQETIITKGGTFSKVDIDLGSGNNNVTIENSFGDVDDNSYNKTRIINWQSGNDTVTIKSGATVKNTEIGVHNGKDVVTLEKDATLEHSRVIMGDGDDTLNINGTVTRESHINLDYGEDTLNVGEGAKICSSSNSCSYL